MALRAQCDELANLTASMGKRKKPVCCVYLLSKFTGGNVSEIRNQPNYCQIPREDGSVSLCFFCHILDDVSVTFVCGRQKKGDRVQHNRLAIVSCVQLLCAQA